MSRANESRNDTILIERLIKVMPSIFKKIIKKNKDKGKSKPSVFDCTYEVSMSFEDYFIRLVELSEIESNTLIYAFMLIDLITENNKVIISNVNIHKLVFTSIYVSMKLLEDEIYNEKHFAIASGIEPEEIALLEKEFLDKLNYSIIVQRSSFETYFDAFK